MEERMNKANAAGSIARLIQRDLINRQELRQAWYAICPEIQDEIMDKWCEITLMVIDGKCFCSAHDEYTSTQED